MFELIRSSLKVLLLLFWYIVANAVAANVALSLANLPIPDASFSVYKHLLPVAIIELIAMALLARSLRTTFLTGSLLLVCFYHSTKHALMLIEAYFYLNLWNQPPLVTAAEVIGLEIMGLAFSVLICPAVVLLFTPSHSKASYDKSNGVLLNRALVPTVVIGGLAYAACYLLAGALILIPLAGPYFSATYENLSVPVWMPLLQVARGIVWVGIIFWYLKCQSTEIKDRQDVLKLSIIVGAGIVIFGAAQLWIPNTLMPRELQIAHIVELSASMFLFGAVVVWLWARLHPSITKL